MKGLKFINLSEEQFKFLLTRAATMGGIEALRLTGTAGEGDLVSRQSLVRKFGRGKVDRMISEGKILPHKIDGGNNKYSLAEYLSYVQ